MLILFEIKSIDSFQTENIHSWHPRVGAHQGRNKNCLIEHLHFLTFIYEIWCTEMYWSIHRKVFLTSTEWKFDNIYCHFSHRLFSIWHFGQTLISGLQWLQTSTVNKYQIKNGNFGDLQARRSWLTSSSYLTKKN